MQTERATRRPLKWSRVRLTCAGPACGNVRERSTWRHLIPLASLAPVRLWFGLHLMRGIPRQAVDRDNSPIAATPY